MEILGVIQVNQLTASGPLNILGQLCGDTAEEDFLGFVRGEGRDHATIISRYDNIFKPHYNFEKAAKVFPDSLVAVQTVMIAL